MRKTVTVIIVCLLSVATARPVESLRLEDLVGVWRIAYEPTEEGRRNLSELSSGYMVFMANRQFYEIRDDCCDGPSAMDQPRPFRINGQSVVLTRERTDGTTYEAVLTYVDLKRVAFEHSTNVFRVEKALVLTVSKGKSLNYSFAKVYPPNSSPN